MMTGKRLALAALLSTLAAASAGPTTASEGWTSSSRGFGHYQYFRSGSPVGYTSPVIRLPRVGTFSRSVWVVRRDRPKSAAPILAPKATIIHVNDGLRLGDFPDACSYESGVCVIRPGN